LFLSWGAGLVEKTFVEEDATIVVTLGLGLSTITLVTIDS
jgi:hypothetical protein